MSGQRTVEGASAEASDGDAFSGIRPYVYWPFAREEDRLLFQAVPQPGDHLTLHTIDRPGTPRSAGNVEVLSTLPDVCAAHSSRVAWAASRARTYLSRAAQRRALLRERRFDVVHVAFLNQFTDVADLRRLKKSAPLVTTVHDVLPHRSRLPSPLQDRVLRAMYRECGSIIVHHERVGAELTRRFGVSSSRISVVPHWVSPNEFRRSGARTLASRPMVLMFGTLRQNKGVETFLRSAERLQGEPIDFHIAGRGEADLEALAAEFGRRLPSLTVEVGWAEPSRKAELHSRADVCVLPYTRFNSQSGVLHDSYGAGTPVVVTDVGALGTAVRADGTGRVIAPDDVAALSSAILGLLADEEEWSTAAAAADEVARRQSPEMIGAALRQVYLSAISRRI